MAGRTILTTLCFVGIYFLFFLCLLFLSRLFCLFFSPEVAGCGVFVNLLGNIHQLNGYRLNKPYAERTAYFLSKIHRNARLELFWYHTSNPKIHTQTHILISNSVETDYAIFHPCKFMRCNVVSGLGYGSPLHL